MKFNVCLEGTFVWECDVNAKTPEDAKKTAESLFNTKIGLLPEDYVVDSATVTEQNNIS